MLHPNFTTFLYFDKEYFNNTKQITFSSEEELFLKEIFDDSETSSNDKNDKIVEEKERIIAEELSKLTTRDYFIFGMAITRPYVLKFIGLGFGITTLILIFLSWLISLCLFKEEEEEPIKKEIIYKKKNH